MYVLVKIFSCFIPSFADDLELLHSWIAGHELRRHWVWKDYQKRWQEKFQARNEYKDTKGNKLHDVSLYLSDALSFDNVLFFVFWLNLLLVEAYCKTNVTSHLYKALLDLTYFVHRVLKCASHFVEVSFAKLSSLKGKWISSKVKNVYDVLFYGIGNERNTMLIPLQGRPLTFSLESTHFVLVRILWFYQRLPFILWLLFIIDI